MLKNCEFCADAFQNTDDINFHLKSIHHYCESCEEFLEIGDNFMSHNEAKHDSNEENDVPEDQDKCDTDSEPDCITDHNSEGSEIDFKPDFESDGDMDLDSASDSELEEYSDSNWFIDLDNYPAPNQNVY